MRQSCHLAVTNSNFGLRPKLPARHGVVDPAIVWVSTPQGKVKVKFTLGQVMKAQRGSGCIFYSFFNFGTRWGWVIKATPRPIYPRERLSTHCVEGWVDECGKSRPQRDKIPGPSARRQSLYRLRYSGPRPPHN
jgi:hypothetical protein